MTDTLQGMDLAPDSLTNLNAQELREMVTELIAQVGENAKTIASKDREILYRQTRIDQLTHEMAMLKRWKFERSREQLDQA
jgi:polyhydroxyalkanoate synthesis regulator phasin